MEIGIIALIVFVSLFAIWLIFYFIPVGLWFSALVSGVRISLLQLILMRWRKVPPSTIVSSMIESTKAGLELNPNELEAHYLAGGNVTNVVHALVSAQKANIMLDFKMATAIDLAGRDVFEAVQMSVNPKVINTPPVAAVAKDGIQLIAKARVTVRANIKQLVGGAGEETVLARVGEGIVSSIGSAQSHKIVLENPDSISRVVLEKGLDAGTAFEILSIDIADIDVGKNIGAQLQMDQAEADKNIAQAKAEERRAMAVALEQENKAKAQDARAKVILAEAEVPLAMAEAFRSGLEAIEPIQTLKTNYLGGKNPRLHTDEILIALSSSAAQNPTAAAALKQLSHLKGCDMHSTVILSSVDMDTVKKLGMYLTCEPTYEEADRMYHKK